jgi:hypothetical protein
VSFALVGCFSVVLISGGGAKIFGALRGGWTAAFISTGAISVWEIWSGQHLESNPGLAHAQPEYIASTFFNPNDYAAFLLACLPAVAWGAVAGKTRATRVVHVALLVAWAYLVLYTESRTGILGAAAMTVAALYWANKTGSLRKGGFRIPALTVACFALTLAALIGATSYGTQAVGAAVDPFRSDPWTARSDQTRINLSMVGLKAFVDSGLIGNGPSSFEQAATSTHGTDLGRITKAHNVFVEIAAEYGIVILGPLALCILAAFVSAARRPARPHFDKHLTSMRISTLISLLAIVAGGVAGSSTLAAPWWWVLLGTTVAQAWSLDQLQHPAAPIPQSSGTVLDEGGYPWRHEAL